MISQIANNEIGSSVRTKLNAVIDKVNEHCDPEVHRALIAQAGVAAPTATVLVNTLSAAIVWSRFSAGLYYGTLAGAFPASKTFLLMSATVNVTDLYAITWVDANTIAIQTTSAGVAADGVLIGDSSLEILVYP